MGWVYECVQRAGRAIVRHARRRAVRRAAGIGSIAATATIAPKPAKPYIRPDGPVCKWVWHEDGSQLGGALPPTFAGLPSYADGLYGGSVSPPLLGLGAREYANSLAGGQNLILAGGYPGGVGSYQPGGNFGDYGGTVPVPVGPGSVVPPIGPQLPSGDQPAPGTNVPPPDQPGQPTPVPEPASIALFCVGLLVIALARRSRRA